MGTCNDTIYALSSAKYIFMSKCLKQYKIVIHDHDDNSKDIIVLDIRKINTKRYNAMSKKDRREAAKCIDRFIKVATTFKEEMLKGE